MKTTIPMSFGFNFVIRGVTRLIIALALILATNIQAEEIAIGSPAPLFTALNHNGQEFSLKSRENQGWTVLFFYPKAETPGCTKQACAFRDAIDKIRALNAEVYGISSDTVEKQNSFHKNHNLKFDLLADPESIVISLYAVKLPLIGMAKRWTFIIDPQLIIRSIEKDVDPMLDAIQVAGKLSELQR